jgi:phosphate-selective porin OprO/OprP
MSASATGQMPRLRSATWVLAVLVTLPWAARCDSPNPLQADDDTTEQAKTEFQGSDRPKDFDSDEEPPPKKEKKKKRRVRLIYSNRPQLRVGKVLRVDFRVKIQADNRSFYPFHLTQEGDFELHRVRVGIQGRLFKDFEFEVEREINEEASDWVHIDHETVGFPWRDVYVNWRHFRRVQFQVGKFKMPFGMEQLTGPTQLDFIYRSRTGQELEPGRAQGMMVHGRLLNRRLGYQFGLFRTDGEKAQVTELINDVGDKAHTYTGVRTFAGRLIATPLQWVNVPDKFKDIQVGAAFTSTSVPEGLYGLRGRDIGKDTFFRHIFVRGERRRLGAELRWTPGRFSVKSEFVHVQEQRLKQGFSGEDLPNLIERGWYVSGTWILTGQKYADRDEPNREFIFGRGFGAVELAGRLEGIRYGSADHIGRPSRSPRASNVTSASDRAVTLGINWYWNKHFKVQLNGIREKLEDLTRTPLEGESTYWTRVIRVQFIL